MQNLLYLKVKPGVALGLQSLPDVKTYTASFSVHLVTVLILSEASASTGRKARLPLDIFHLVALCALMASTMLPCFLYRVVL